VEPVLHESILRRGLFVAVGVSLTHPRRIFVPTFSDFTKRPQPLLVLSAFAIALIVAAPFIYSSAHRMSAGLASSGLTAHRAASPLHARSQSVPPAVREHVRARFAALPLAFEKNEGQANERVQYLARGSGYNLYLTASDAVLAVSSGSNQTMSKPRQMMEQRLLGYSRQRRRVIRRQSMQGSRVTPSPVASLRMPGVKGNRAARIEGQQPLPSRVNYFIGKDARNWHRNVEQFGRVRYRDVYPGVDLAYYGQHHQLEFDFIVAPNASAAPIALSFAGLRHLAADASGNLVLSLPNGNLTLRKPAAYQVQDGIRQAVDAKFVLQANHHVGFRLGTYDASRELVIDPSLSYATYLGGNGADESYGIAVDNAGNSYVTGESDSTSGFPGTNPTAGGFDAFVVQLSASGALGYTTILGGSGDDLGSAIAVNPSTGAVYVAGITTSTDLPVTSGAAQSTSGSPASSTCVTGVNNVAAACTDGFIFQLTAAGVPAYVTYLGGSNDDGAFGVAIDPAGNAYVTGFTFSSDFPRQSALFPTFNNGGLVTPPFEDAFVAEVNSSGTAWIYSTYLGGQNNDYGNAIAVDASGNAYITGGTSSADFPVSTGAFQTQCGTDGACNANQGGNGLLYSDAFVTKLSAGGSSQTLLYSTFLGGSGDDSGAAIALDTAGNLYVTGQTAYDNSTLTTDDFPVVMGGFQGTFQSTSGGINAFVSKLNPAGGGTSDLVYSSYLGGNVADTGLGIAVDPANNAYVTGSTLSSNFPHTGGFQTSLSGNSDAFVTQVLSGGASLGYSSYLGGVGDEDYDISNAAFLGAGVALSPSAQVFLAGSTSSSSGFPAGGTPLQGSYGGGSFDAFEAVVATTSAPDFTIAGTTPAAVAPGAAGTSTITLTSVNGYASSVALTCSVSGTGSPLPACSASSFAPTSVTPTSSGATSTLTITTTGPSAALAHPGKIFYAMWLPFVGMAFVGTGMRSKASRKKLIGVLMMGTVLFAICLMPACGGSGSSGGGGGSTGTLAGTYTVTITGTGTDASTTTHTTTVSLTVN
jgi:hypothetical protein